jgi:uncharacterized membrane protein
VPQCARYWFETKKETLMSEVTVTQIVNAPVADVWAVWDDFGNIADFNPGVEKSYLLNGSSPGGLGAERQCDFIGGKIFVREKVVGYTPHKQMVIDIYDGNIPVKNAGATLNFKSLGANRTEVEMTMRFTPKMGLLGKMMVPMMKKQFRGALDGLLAGNANFVEATA